MTNVLRWLLGLTIKQSRVEATSQKTLAANLYPMNEGDLHSGPYGYSPNTAYPETQYGSNFDEEAEWNEEH